MTVADTFDFTEFVLPNEKRWWDNKLPWTGNDVAYLDENLGVINPIGVNIDFKYNYK